MTTEHIIGLDLSIAATGIATHHTTWTADTSPRDGDIVDRARLILSHIRYALAGTAQPKTVVAEDYVSGSRHTPSELLLLHGIVRWDLQTMRDAIVWVPPATLKKYATGKGNASKVDVIIAARERLGLDSTDDNQADALWLRAIGCELAGHPLAVMPKANRSALDKLEHHGIVA